MYPSKSKISMSRTQFAYIWFLESEVHFRAADVSSSSIFRQGDQNEKTMVLTSWG